MFDTCCHKLCAGAVFERWRLRIYYAKRQMYRSEVKICFVSFAIIFTNSKKQNNFRCVRVPDPCPVAFVRRPGVWDICY